MFKWQLTWIKEVINGGNSTWQFAMHGSNDVTFYLNSVYYIFTSCLFMHQVDYTDCFLLAKKKKCMILIFSFIFEFYSS